MTFKDVTGKTNKGQEGGCLIYYKSHFNVIPQNQINKSNEIESVWIELVIRSQRFIIGVLHATHGISFIRDLCTTY